jgi:hypothetical protein
MGPVLGGRAQHAATAEALAVHRNTLEYGPRRIEQITGKVQSQPDAAFNLQLATRAWNFRALQRYLKVRERVELSALLRGQGTAQS